MFVYMRQIAGMPKVQNEWELEQVFRENGPYFHLHTKPLETGVIFTSDAERAVALVHIAVAAADAGVEILAYALMSNHFHFILRGREELCREYFRQFIGSLAMYLTRHGRHGALKDADGLGITPIASLKQFRDEVAYVVRNPFVVRVDINPLAYRWCSGFLYFNPILDWVNISPVDGLTVQEKRQLAHSRTPHLPKGLAMVSGWGSASWQGTENGKIKVNETTSTSSRLYKNNYRPATTSKRTVASEMTAGDRQINVDGRNMADGQAVEGGMIFPGSFVNWRLVETLFGNARQFMAWVFKNVEANVETALRLGEKPTLTDDDLLTISLRICRNDFGVRGPSLLSDEQKYTLAKRLKYDYYASNGQVARFTSLPLRTVDAFFPLATKSSSTKQP